MPKKPRQSGPIAVYGATGYTGKLVAAELAAANADFVISGRNEAKLNALVGELRTGVKALAAPLDDPIALRTLLDDCAAVINCAGPFTLYGEPVLEAAVDTETHYLDTTGEQDYIRVALSKYGPEAEKAGVAVIPTMGFDYVPGDMIASLTAQGLGELDSLTLNYAVAGFKATRGTARSAIEGLTGGDTEWRDLKWREASGRMGRGTFEFPEIGAKRMARYPSGEQITVPRHVPTKNVITSITASTVAGPLGRAISVVGPATSIAMRTPLKRLLSAGINRLPEGPSPEDRANARFMIVCDAVRGGESRRGIIRGRDVYGLTAAMVARGALIAAGKEFEGRGGLAPAQAFEPREFLSDLDRFGISWELAGAGPSEAQVAEPAAAAV